jgi:hypothetical protein
VASGGNAIPVVRGHQWIFVRHGGISTVALQPAGVRREVIELLNLARIFEVGIFVFRNFSSFLTVPPLQATMFMMRRDMVNHCRNALTHYLAVPLDALLLQDESPRVLRRLQRLRRWRDEQGEGVFARHESAYSISYTASR